MGGAGWMERSTGKALNVGGWRSSDGRIEGRVAEITLVIGEERGGFWGNFRFVTVLNLMELCHIVIIWYICCGF